MARCLIDLSAWAKSAHPDAKERWAEMVKQDELLCHPVFAVEMLHNAINPEEYGKLRAALDTGFDWLWPDVETAGLAVQLQERMATTATTGQRVKTADILTAALAVQHGAGVVHHDTDYDAIRGRGGEPFESVWLPPKGSPDPASGTNARRASKKAFGERMIQLQNDEDLVVWPELIEWLDERLRERGIEPPPPPDVP